LIPHLGTALTAASGTSVELGEESVEWSGKECGGWVEHAGWRLSIPEEARVLWPEHCFNPYAKDGVGSLSAARVVVALPLSPEVRRHELTLRATE
ncbi:MAG: hypothetical protein ACE5JM_00300, partial [Armatimonadota bacterium]